jgi:hypothetical protein
MNPVIDYFEDLEYHMIYTNRSLGLLKNFIDEKIASTSSAPLRLVALATVSCGCSAHPALYTVVFSAL